MTLDDILRPDAVEDVKRATARALAQGSTELVEYSIEQPERDVEPIRHIEARIVRSGADEVVAIVRDITERKRQEEALESLVDEQAALSRVAVAVATEKQPEILFDIVTEALGRLLGADAANLVRFAPDSVEGHIVGKWSEPGVAIGEQGTTVIMDGGPLTRVHRTGKPARGGIDDPDISPLLRQRLIELGVTSVVAAPIEVSGELWGSIVVSVTSDKAFPEGAEERIGKFAALVSVALANAETLAALSTLAAEQAALSRVAVAVATEEPDGLFDVVTQEVALRLGADGANLIRFDPRDELEGVVVGTWSNYEAEIAPVGTRVRTTGGPVTRVRQTAQPARGHIDDPDIIPSPLVDRLREHGVRSIVAAPIVVSGALWGAVMLSTNDDRRFSADAEARIAQFTNLVAVALANAEAHEQLSTLAEEQAALSRVAVAVATEEQRDRLFNIATEEIGRLFGARAAAIVRFLDDPDEAELVGAWEPHSDSPVELGARLPYRGGAATVVRRTGRAARVDLENTPDDVRREMEAGGVTSGVAAPIVVSGRPWGATTISIDGSDRFQPDAEERLEKFTRLVAVALANAQAREELAELAEEQAALRRVAVAAATEAPERLFDVVTEETARFFGAKRGSLVRYLDEGHVEVVGIWEADGEHERRVGDRFPLLGGAVTRVKETGRPARFDHDYDQDDTPRQMVAAPIVVAGELWGAASISSPLPHTFSPGVEERLEKFTGLVAVALANAQANRSLATLAEEQSALNRVALAVATQESPTASSTWSRRRSDACSARAPRRPALRPRQGRVGDRRRLGARRAFRRRRRSPAPVSGRRDRTSRAHRAPRPRRPRKERPTVRDAMSSTDVSSHVAAPIVVTGQLWGATSVSVGPPDRFPPDSEERLGKFTGLVALALANAEARKQLTASRARIVQAGDAARRRLERNLHDGAQQRLVTLSLTLRLAQARLHDDPAAAQELLEASSVELASALEELRELARGLHPAILSDRGLEAALEALATRTPVPVKLDHLPEGRLPPPVEAAAYYVVAESLTNVAKYADASSARVKVEQRNGYAIVEVEDDGVGGVDITHGSGLRGLADRVEALDGRLIVSSEAGRGTRVRAEIPCS